MCWMRKASPFPRGRPQSGRADLYKATATGRSVVVYTTKVSAAIFPNRDLGEQRAEVIAMISTHMDPKKVRIRG